MTFHYLEHYFPFFITCFFYLFGISDSELWIFLTLPITYFVYFSPSFLTLSIPFSSYLSVPLPFPKFSSLPPLSKSFFLFLLLFSSPVFLVRPLTCVSRRPLPHAWTCSRCHRNICSWPFPHPFFHQISLSPQGLTTLKMKRTLIVLSWSPLSFSLSFFFFISKYLSFSLYISFSHFFFYLTFLTNPLTNKRDFALFFCYLSSFNFRFWHPMATLLFFSSYSVVIFRSIIFHGTKFRHYQLPRK